MKAKTTAITIKSCSLLNIIVGMVFLFQSVSGISQTQQKAEGTDAILAGYPPTWNPVIPNTLINPHEMVIMMSANPRINTIPINPGDFIGAFFVDNNGQMQCAGADYWQDLTPINLPDTGIVFPIFADNTQTPEKDGFTYNELIHFRIFSWTTQKTYDVDFLSFDPAFYPYNNNNYVNWVGGVTITEIVNMQCIETLDAFATATPNPVCAGNTVALAANIFIGTTGNYNYNWTSNPPGFTSNMQNPIVSPSVSTNYLLSVSDGSNTSNHQILVVVNQNPLINAGSDKSACANQNVQLSASAANYSSLLWSTSGNGSFNNPGVLNPSYSYGTNDLQNGSVVLTLTAQPLGGCSSITSDQLIVTVLPLPTVNAGPDKLSCKGSPVSLDASTAINYSSILWATSGNGTFSNPNILHPQYFPGTNDLTVGSFTLTLTVNAASPCTGIASDQILITLAPPPIANGPANKVICETVSTVTISGSNSSNYSSLLWVTAGDGTFNNPTIPVTIYAPGPNDKINGGTVVTLNAFPNAPCTVPSTKQVTVTIKKLPIIDAGNTNQVCEGLNLQLNATASNYDSIIWTSSGNGVFNNHHSKTAIYMPGSIDISAGQFTLTLTGTSLFPCTLSVSDQLFVGIIPAPEVQINTASNQAICASEPIQLNATGSDYDNLLWSTSGNGTFDNPAILNPVYAPGPSDISGNPINLTLAGFADSGCGTTATDQISVTFGTSPTANAGVDATIIPGTAFSTENASTQNATSIVWSTSGDGVFENANVLHTLYTPGNADLTNETVRLSLTASNAFCNPASDDVILFFVGTSLNPTAFAGEDATICEEGSFILENAAASNYSSLLWTTNGDGSFNNITLLNPTYTPGAQDKALGVAQLCLKALPVAPSTMEASDCLVLNIQKRPEAMAGADATITDNQSFSVSATAANYSSLEWATTGDGTFNNASLLNPVYSPGLIDIENSTVELTLSAVPVSPCTGTTNDALTLTILRQQIIQLNNGWNSFSSFVVPSDPNFEQVMAPISGNLIVAKSLEKVYWPTYGINTIGNFYPTDGYLVKLSAASSLPITGFKSQNKTVQLKQGWNILPVISDRNVESEILLTQLADKLIIATEIAGTGIIWPETAINTIPFLIPGKAYYVKVNNPCSFTFPD